MTPEHIALLKEAARAVADYQADWVTETTQLCRYCGATWHWSRNEKNMPRVRGEGHHSFCLVYRLRTFNIDGVYFY